MKLPMNYTDDELTRLILTFQDIDMVGYDNRTLFIHACKCNRLDLVKRLLELGADVNKKDYYQKVLFIVLQLLEILKPLDFCWSIMWM